MKILSIVGARPQFVKAAMVHQAVNACPQGCAPEHLLVHTGQHYDARMSSVFFEELSIPTPDVNLGVGSGKHGEQTGEMIRRLEPVLEETRPDWVVLYGDTNSTLAGSVVASKLHIPAAHVEAGLRSFNRRMPEELNRIATDHLSDLLLAPTPLAMKHLEREGLKDRAVLTGDVMYDAALYYRRLAEERGGLLADAWPRHSFALATIHRAENTDDPARLLAILEALETIAAGICAVLLPLHPRTAKTLQGIGWTARCVRILPPVSYLEMLLLEGRARLILTDSGGVQKEAFFAKVPCVTLRDETEWEETLDNRCNVLAGASRDRIVEAARQAGEAGPWADLYGDGRAGSAILAALGGA